MRRGTRLLVALALLTVPLLPASAEQLGAPLHGWECRFDDGQPFPGFQSIDNPGSLTGLIQLCDGRVGWGPAVVSCSHPST